MITAVAVLEFISAGFAIMISVVALAGGALFAGAANEIESQTGVDAAAAIGGIFIVLAVIMIAIAALQIYAGVQVLKLRERGRMISLVLSIISVAMSVLQLGGENQGSVVVGLALNGFIIYACMTQKDAFSQQGI